MSPITSKKTSLDFSIESMGDLMRMRYRRILASFLLLIFSVYPGDLGEVTRLAVFDA